MYLTIWQFPGMTHQFLNDIYENGLFSLTCFNDYGFEIWTKITYLLRLYLYDIIWFIESKCHIYKESWFWVPDGLILALVS